MITETTQCCPTHTKADPISKAPSRSEAFLHHFQISPSTRRPDI